MGGAHRDVADPRPVEAEHDAPLQARGRVVEVDHGPPRAAKRRHGALDLIIAGLGDHLDGDVFGDEILFDQRAHEVEVRPRSRWKADLDLFEADAQQLVEHAPLALDVHRFDEGLIAIAQIDTAPARRAIDRAIRPTSIGQLDRRKGSIFGFALGRHIRLLHAEPGAGVGDDESGVNGRCSVAQKRQTLSGRCGERGFGVRRWRCRR